MRLTRTPSWPAAGLLLILAGAAGCGGDDPDPADTGPRDTGPSDTGDVRAVVSIAVSPNPVSVRVGETAALTVTATFDDGTTANRSAQAVYMSSDREVATVGPTGIVTGASVGTASINVELAGRTASVDVSVTEGMVGGPRTLPMTVDEHFTGRAGFSESGAPLHTEDNECPMRAGGMNGACHRFRWDGQGGTFTGAFWIDGTGFDDINGVPVVAGATEITFQAWGAAGGEVVEFGAGLNNAGLQEAGGVRRFITLSTSPTQYTVSLEGFTYSEVRGAFLVALASMSNPSGATIYVDDIRWAARTIPMDDVPLPMTVDTHFSGRAAFGDGGPPLHTEDDMCPMRAGDMNGECHRFTWNGQGGGFTGSFWVNGTGFEDITAVPVAAGATEITFQAWGAAGGEVVEFGAGLNNPNLGEANGVRQFITLTTSPTQYTVSLEAFPYMRVRGAFLVALSSMSNPSGATIYIDDIRWVEGSAPTEIPLPMTVDEHFSGRAGFGDGGPPLHNEDAMCPMRAGGMNGDCHRIIWNGQGGGFTGAFWVNGTGFDDLRGRRVAPGATEISFYAWGARGGEVVEVGAGLANSGLGEAASVRENITLTTTPTQYFIPLANFGAYTQLFGPFIFALNNGANPSGATFYLDDIQWTVGGIPSGIPLPMVVDANFPDRSAFGDGGPPLHTEDDMCPSRAGSQRGECHRFVWNGQGGAFTGTFWTVGEGFMGLQGLRVAPGANAVSFWAWGQAGGEVIEFGAGLNNPNLGEGVGVRDFITLSTTPTQYSVDLAAFGNYSNVFGPFLVAIGNGANPAGATFFVDDIAWVRLAQRVVLGAHPEDRVVSWNGGMPALREAFIGGATVGDAEGGTAFIIPFVLPPLPTGSGFTEASLNIQVINVAGAMENAMNADLYGLPYRTAAAAAADGVVLTSMFHADSTPDPNATMILPGFLTPSTASGAMVNTDVAALVAYLNAQIAAGAQAGDFVYLRISPNLPPPIGAATTWVITAAVDANAPPERPTLTIR